MIARKSTRIFKINGGTSYVCACRIDKNIVLENLRSSKLWTVPIIRVCPFKIIIVETLFENMPTIDNGESPVIKILGLFTALAYFAQVLHATTARSIFL